MPSAVFPRNDKWEPVDVTDLDVTPALHMRSHSGVVKSRATLEVGFGWEEEYPILNINDSDIREFLAWLRWATRRGIHFTIDHPTSPGSGLSRNGSGSGTVDGAGQAGEDINTTGGTFAAGDLVTIDGLTNVFEITETDTGVMHLNPPIVVGNEPANGAAITTTDVTFTAKIVGGLGRRNIEQAYFYGGLRLRFVEVPNE